MYLPGRLAALAELAWARPDLDVLTSDAVLEVDGEAVRRCYTPELPFEVDDQRSAILRRNFVFGLAAVRRERFLEAGGFDESLRYATDWDLWARLILDGSRVGAVMEPLARYRLRAGSLSGSRANLLAGRVRVLEKAAGHPSLSDGSGEPSPIRSPSSGAAWRSPRRGRLSRASFRIRAGARCGSPSAAGMACRRASRAWPRRLRRAGREAGSPRAIARRPAASAYLRAEKDPASDPGRGPDRRRIAGRTAPSPARRAQDDRLRRPDRDRRSDPPVRKHVVAAEPDGLGGRGRRVEHDDPVREDALPRHAGPAPALRPVRRRRSSSPRSRDPAPRVSSARRRARSGRRSSRGGSSPARSASSARRRRARR